MKTAIFIPNAIFKSAEHTAKRMGLSRSKFFTRAVTVFVEEHQSLDVTAALNRVYAGEAAVLEHGFKALQKRFLGPGLNVF